MIFTKHLTEFSRVLGSSSIAKVDPEGIWPFQPIQAYRNRIRAVGRCALHT